MSDTGYWLLDAGYWIGTVTDTGLNPHAPRSVKKDENFFEAMGKVETI